MEHYTEFLPISRADMEARGWDQLDFVVVGGDAYVDHPSFGTAIISRLLEAEGYKVGVLAQPRYTDCEDFKRFGKPKYGFFIGGGNVDSMVSYLGSPTAAPPSTPDLPSRHTPTCPSFWAVWKHRSAALPTTTTGWTPSCPASPRTLARTSSASAWGNTRPWKLPAVWRQGSRWRASPMWTAPAT